MNAAYGKYSVLGNHDYGDYVKWDTEQEKHANLNRLKKVHKEIGFNLLLNEAVKIKRGDQSIALIGVENWGKGGFHKYGDLKKSAEQVPDEDFKILMSHDPSHWEAKTLLDDKHIDLIFGAYTWHAVRHRTIRFPVEPGKIHVLPNGPGCAKRTASICMLTVALAF